MIVCSSCKAPYPETGAPYRCLVCGGLYDWEEFSTYTPDGIENEEPGIWRFSHTYGSLADGPRVSMGEGDTPLEWAEVEGQQVAFKLDYENPTGSFKDRGAALLVSFLTKRGITDVVEDSSGNAGAALAAYAQKGGINAKVYIPDTASGPKRDQIIQYGAEVVGVPGGRSATSEAVLRQVDEGAIYASHNYLPVHLAGYGTMAYEIVEQMGAAPGTVLIPVGHGGLFVGVARGFENLHNSGVIENMPHLVGVQAMACAPLWAYSRMGRDGLAWVTEGETLAEGIRSKNPVRGDAVLQLLKKHGGEILAVEEHDILAGRNELEKRGFKVEPTSAVIWDALNQGIDRFAGPIAVILTGAGYKYSG